MGKVVMGRLGSKNFTQWKNVASSTCSSELRLNLYIKFHLTQDKIATDLSHYNPIVQFSILFSYFSLRSVEGRELHVKRVRA